MRADSATVFRRVPLGLCTSKRTARPIRAWERAHMLFDFSEAERNTIRYALEIYVTDLREEIVKTEKHDWREALHLEKQILEGVIEQLSV